MKISYRWLARHVDLAGVDAKQVARELTLSTAEVEGVEPFLPHLADVTVGHVVQREKHPNADKLSLCRVDVGQGEPLQIVCGAPNVAAGQKVAVATVGTVLPGDFKIKKSKIRDVESNGMICSERELGLGDEHDGIWLLPSEARIGTRVANAIEGARDWVIEIDNKSITHRPDLWGHRGVAAEVAAILRRPLKPLDTQLPPLGSGKSFPVRIDTPNCPRYLALQIDGARAAKSPFWLRSLLLAVGQRPIDLLVDLSNFVMLDLGQPNHLFDRKRLSPEGIVVRMARASESMTTLDGLERKLETSDMLICNGDAPVALAGIMGGEGSKVTGDTSQLLLEVANFRASTVRKTSARLGLRTDASARFEKSLDPTLPPLAAAHFARLLVAEQPEVRVSAPAADVGEWKDPSRTIELRGARVRKLLGAKVSNDEIVDILTRLGFSVRPRGDRMERFVYSIDLPANDAELTVDDVMQRLSNIPPPPGDAFEVRVPSNRATKDIAIEQDLVEEVGRIYRYGNIPERALTGEILPPPRDEGWARRMLVRKIEDRLAGSARFHQTISYAFVPDALLEKLALVNEPHVSVLNAINEGASRVRRSVVPSVLALLEANRRRRAEVRLFEIGKGYLPKESGEPRELHELALALSRPKKDGARFDDNAQALLQGLVENLIASLGLERVVWTRAQSPSTWANPGRSVVARFANSEAITAEVASLDPGVANSLGLSGELASDTAIARLDIDVLLAAPKRSRLYTPLPQFPDTLVDIALSLPEDKSAGEAQSGIERAGKGQIASLELFDVFTGGSLGPGRKSLAWHVVLRANDRTLTDQDVKKFLDRVARAAEELGGELRRA